MLTKYKTKYIKSSTKWKLWQLFGERLLSNMECNKLKLTYVVLLPECLSSRDLRIAPSQRASQSRLFAQAGSASRPVSTCTSMNLLWLCYLSWSLQLAADPRKGEIRSYLISTNALTISNMYALRQGWLISLCKRVISTRTNACGYLLN